MGADLRFGLGSAFTLDATVNPDFGQVEADPAVINLSAFEAFSFVVMESWLAGTPVVVSNRCAVTTGHCARSGGGVAVSSQEELSAALESLCDRELGALAGEAGRQHVVAEYSWDRVTDAFARSLLVECES